MLRTFSGCGFGDDIEWGRPYGLVAVDAADSPCLYVSDERAGAILRLDAEGNSKRVVSGLRCPQGLAVEGGRLYVCEAGRARIVAVDIETAKQEFTWDGVKIPSGVDTIESTMWVASAGDHAVYARDVRSKDPAWVVAGMPGQSGNMKYDPCGDGGPATEARLFSPFDVSASHTGEVYIADAFNGRVRMVDGGILRTVAGADQSAPRGNRGPATEIIIGQPRSVALSASGPFVAAVPGLIWQLREGHMEPVVGTWVDGYNGDEGEALEMRLHTPCCVSVWRGLLAVADSDNKRIVLIDRSES